MRTPYVTLYVHTLYSLIFPLKKSILVIKKIKLKYNVDLHILTKLQFRSQKLNGNSFEKLNIF